MKRRTAIWMVAILTGGLLAGAAALAYGGYRHRHEMMQRFVTSAIDDALDRAGGVTPEQRRSVHAARDRVFAAFQEHRRDRTGRAQEVLSLFEAEQVDPAALTALRARIEDEHRKMGDVITQAVVEVHDVLTPAQRKALADYVRERHRRFH